MKVPLADGSIAEVTVEEFELLADAMGWRAAPMTHAEKMRVLIDEIKVSGVPVSEDMAAVMPEAVELEDNTPVREVVVMPENKVLPAHIATPPIAYINQAQALVIELLRHHPEGLRTKQIAEKLRWDHSKATRQTTAMERGIAGMPKLVETVSGHYRYRLTALAKRSAFKIVTQPARMRQKVDSGA